MTKTEQKVIKLIGEKELIREGDSILTAFSGGPDSVFLLTFLLKFRRKYKINIAAFHLNHMLRKQAGKDELFCKRFCEERGVIFHSSKIDIKTTAANAGISVEEAGRNTRYGLLEETADENIYTKIATGHNLDDNTETVLLNLIKGTGIKGISGIPYKRGRIIRPLLSVSKEEIKEFLHNENIPYLLDRSNLKNDYERNFIRNRIIPLVRSRLNPSVDEAVLRSSDNFKEIASYTERKVAEAFDAVSTENKQEINVRGLNTFDPELRTGVIKKFLERNIPSSVTFKDIISVLILAGKPAGKSVRIGNNSVVFRERDHLVISGEKKSDISRIKVSVGIPVYIDGQKLSIEKYDGKTEFSGNKNMEFIDGGKSGSGFIVRKWRPGDKFRPIGMKGTMKVSDFLNSIKIPSSEKKNKMVLTNGKEILWVIGCRISEDFKLTSNTRRVFKLCLK